MTERRPSVNPRLRVLPIWAARAGDPTHYLILDRAEGLDTTGLQRIGSETNVQILIFAKESERCADQIRAKLDRAAA